MHVGLCVLLHCPSFLLNPRTRVHTRSFLLVLVRFPMTAKRCHKRGVLTDSPNVFDLLLCLLFLVSLLLLDADGVSGISAIQLRFGAERQQDGLHGCVWFCPQVIPLPVSIFFSQLQHLPFFITEERATNLAIF